jgi:hypothetical protein
VRRSFTSAVVDVSKLRDYCLSETHPRGRHKARVFGARLGLGVADAEFIQQRLLEAVSAAADRLVPTDADQHGERYMLDVEITTVRGTATVRSGWIVRLDEDVLRFVTCFIL